MTKIALITDTHWGARGDSVIFANYFGDFYYKHFFPYLKENNIDRIFHLGDIVDKRKNINYVTSRYLKTFVKTCDDNNIRLDVLIGNHDASMKNTNEYNSMEELYSHSRYDIHYYSSPQEIEIDGVKIALLPWICSGNYSESMEFIKNTRAQILFGHLEIQGFEMYRGYKNDHGMKASIFDKFDIVCSGHFHHKSSSGNIHYLGAPYEITWGDWNDPRGFHVFDTETREFTYIENKYKMFHKIYYNEDNMETELDKYKNSHVKVIIEKRTDNEKFDKFFSSLEKVGLSDLQVIEDPHLDIDYDDTIEEVEDTRILLHSVIESIDIKVDKNRLKSEMDNIYNEALNTE